MQIKDMNAFLSDNPDSPFTKQLSSIESQILSSNTLIYRTFATKPIDSFLGISIQKERLYVVQKKTICLFEYFVGYDNTSTQKAPVLIKEILLPFEVSKYIITEKYICIKSKNKTQIRDNEFQKVFYSENSGIMVTRPPHQNEQVHNSNDFTFDTVEEFELECEIINDEMVSWKVVTKKKSQSTNARYLREYWSERYNILTRHKFIVKCRAEMIDPSNKNRKIQICKSPVFVNQLGYIQNFYIWPFSSNDIQVGIFYNYKEQQNVTENHLYEICSFQLKETTIKNIFHYNFTNANSAKNKDGPHLFLAVCENNQPSSSKDKSLIKIVIFEILPEQNLGPNQSLNEALNNCLDQFNQLRKQNKSQQSLSNSNLLNELLNAQGKSSVGSNPNQPTIIIQSFILKNSGSLKKIFYNPLTNVLWINDASQLVYRIKFIETGDLKDIRENNLSFIESLEGFKNGETKPDLEGVMYDNYPILKVNAFNLEIGTRMAKEIPEIQGDDDNELENTGKTFSQHDSDQKELIEFDDKELEKIEQQKSKDKLNLTKLIHPSQTNKKNGLKICAEVQITSNHQLPKPEIDLKIKPQLSTQQTQTENDFIVCSQVPNEDQKQIQINNLSQLLKQLNFNKVEEVLMRFSQIFSGLVTKNVNKLKDFNQKAKEEIKLKINGDIFQLIKEVYTSLMSDALTEKIEKEVLKAREFVQKIFNKHIEHFNLMLIDQRTKEENIKKCILEEQLRSIDIIKQASFKFLDVTKIREMQKIAYNQVVVDSIKQVGKKLEDLQTRLDQFSRESQETENKIMEEVKEIKETFKLLIQLEEDDSEKDQGEDADEVECSESGFESESEEEDEVNDKSMIIGRKRFEDKGIPQRHGVEPAQHYSFMGPHQIPSFNERAPGWNSFYQGPISHPYQSYPPPQYASQYPSQFYPSPSQQQFYPSPQIFYPPMSQVYSGQSMPFTGTMQSHQPSYMPSPPSFITPQYSQIRKGPQVEVEKKEKKRRVKSSGKGSLLMKNE